MKKIIFALVVTCFVAVGCKNEQKEAKTTSTIAVKAENLKEVSFNVSGMTCEIGCAKTIASKLSKQEGVVEANVIFTDSIAKVKFDATKTDAKKLMAYVDGIGGDIYKTSALKSCSEDCKKECCSKKETKKTACNEDCKKECCADKEA